MSFVMYSTSWCGYCKRLKSQLAEVGVTFEEINIEEVQELLRLLRRSMAEIAPCPLLFLVMEKQ